jgi:hypothetical protein
MYVYMNFFDYKDLGNHLLQFCPKVVNHPVYKCVLYNLKSSHYLHVSANKMLHTEFVDIFMMK